MEKEQVKKYPLEEVQAILFEKNQKYALKDVQALLFEDRKSASDFIESNEDRIRDFRPLPFRGQIMVLFVWKH